MTRHSMLMLAPLVFGMYLPMCPTPELRPTMAADQADISELWVRPVDIARQDLFYGPWGREVAPKSGGTYRFVRPKTGGGNPGVTVLDAQGRKWSVKQAHHDPARNPEGPVEVVVSRVPTVLDKGRSLPVDAIVSDPILTSTHAVTINAPAPTGVVVDRSDAMDDVKSKWRSTRSKEVSCFPHSS